MVGANLACSVLGKTREPQVGMESGEKRSERKAEPGPP